MNRASPGSIAIVGLWLGIIHVVHVISLERPAYASPAMERGQELRSAAAHSGSLSPTCTVSFSSGTLSVDVVATPLRFAVDRLLAKIGGTIAWLGPPGDELVTARFSGLPLEEGLARILRYRNYVAEVTPDSRRLLRLWISAPNAASSFASSSAGAPTPLAHPAEDPASFESEDHYTLARP
jgi:hypothetical protein